MLKTTNINNAQIINISDPRNFQFHAVKIKDLNTTRRTLLITTICDISGNIRTLTPEFLRKMQVMIVNGLLK